MFVGNIIFERKKMKESPVSYTVVETLDVRVDLTRRFAQCLFFRNELFWGLRVVPFASLYRYLHGMR